MITMGADVEFFFMNPTTGAVVPSDQLLPSKRKPLKVAGHKGKLYDESGYPLGILHVDGIQGELTVAPSGCRSWILDYMRDGLVAARKIADEKGLVLSTASCVPTPEEILSVATEEGVAFGCDPDFAAWDNGAVNINEIYPRQHYQRYAGCHLHLGIPEKYDDEDVVNIVQLLDMYLGCSLVLLERDDPTVAQRRAVFGKAGVFRYTKYGLEYRVPSARLLNHPYLYHFAFGVGRWITEMYFNDKRFFSDSVENLNRNPLPVINAINTNDPEQASWVLKKLDRFPQFPEYRGYLGALNSMEMFDASRFEENWYMDIPQHSYHASMRGVIPGGENFPLNSYFAGRPISKLTLP